MQIHKRTYKIVLENKCNLGDEILFTKDEDSTGGRFHSWESDDKLVLPYMTLKTAAIFFRKLADELDKGLPE